MHQARFRTLTGTARAGILLSLLLPMLVGAPAASAETAVISATVKDGQVVVTWSLPANDARAAAVEARHTATNIRWSTNPATVASSGNNEGSSLACWLTGPSDGKHDCTGGRDLPDNATSFTITGLAPGTYYVQLQTYGLKYVAQYDSLYHFNAYSNVVTVVVPPPPPPPAPPPPVTPPPPTPPPSGGGSSGADTGTRVTLSSEATIVSYDKNGAQTVTKTSGTITLPDIRTGYLQAGEKALQLAVNEGRVVLGPHAKLATTCCKSGTDPKGTAVLYLEGTARFSGKDYRVMGVGTAVVRTIGISGFAVDTTTIENAVTVRALRGKVKVKQFGASDRTMKILKAGFETIVFDGKAPSKPRKFKK